MIVLGGLLFAGGRAGIGPLAWGGFGGRDEGPDRLTRCPLTGVKPVGAVPARPALAIKVENSVTARPQVGLSWADVVYEEPVEGGITRFIAVYHCQDAGRVEPVRSARLVDPDILVQFGRPVFGYAGAVQQVVDAVRRAGLVDVSDRVAPRAYQRDPARLAPHNLYTSTRALYRSARQSSRRAPSPVFTYSAGRLEGRRVKEIHVPFSLSSDVRWRFDAERQVYLRFHGEDPHTLTDGTQVSARNVIVQVVRVRPGTIKDVNGVRSPDVEVVGSGRAYVLRRGRMVAGRWERESLEDVTRFVDAGGDEIVLAPGATWVELAPSGISVSTS